MLSTTETKALSCDQSLFKEGLRSLERKSETVMVALNTRVVELPVEARCQIFYLKL